MALRDRGSTIEFRQSEGKKPGKGTPMGWYKPEVAAVLLTAADVTGKEIPVLDKDEVSGRVRLGRSGGEVESCRGRFRKRVV